MSGIRDAIVALTPPTSFQAFVFVLGRTFLLLCSSTGQCLSPSYLVPSFRRLGPSRLPPC